MGIGILILMTFCSLYAQYQIRGTVLNFKDRPIEFAIIELRKTDQPSGNAILQKVANEKGEFAIKVNYGGKYLLGVKSLGYSDTTINVSLESDSVSIIKIKMMDLEIKEVRAVTVISKRPFIERRLDRLVMNIENSPISGNRSSLDLMNLAPGVLVTNGEVLLRGMQPARVMINGRMLNLTGVDLENYLNNLKSTEISSIEIMSHPPAEYDAAGNGGLINIILKRSKKDGLNGSLAMNFSQGLGKYPDYIPSANINFHRNKIGITGSLTYDNLQDFLTIGMDRKINQDDGNFVSNTTIDSKIHLASERLGLYYDINKDQYFAIDFSHSSSANKSFSNANTSIIYADPHKSIYSVGYFTGNLPTDFSNLGLNYSIKTDSIGSTFKIISDYTYSNKNAFSGNHNQKYDSNNNLISDTTFNFSYPSSAKIFTAQLNYNKVFKTKTEFSVGGKYTFTDIFTNNYYDIFFNNAWKKDLATAFDFRYRERIYAGYFKLKGSIFKTEYLIGLRGEQSEVNGLLTSTSQQDTANNRKYFNLFPSIFFKKKVNNSGSNYLTFVYNKRVGRPSYSQLNPFRYFIDNYTTREGNPLLTPQFTNSCELSYTLHNKYSLSINYAVTKDIISQVLESNTSNPVMVMKNRNSGYSKNFGLNFSFPVDVTKWWLINSTISAGKIISEAPDYSINSNYFFFQTYQDLNFTNRFSINISGYYRYHTVWANIIFAPLGSLDISCQRKFIENKLITKIGVSDIFYSSAGNTREVSYYNSGNINLTRKAQTRVVFINLIYRFQSGKAFKSDKMENGSAEERKRL